ncbi:type II toxin-antitoxin system HipA family toxin [Falsarthrobacter nasiphocae]|uniref:Serine/threonine-protein kinase HipA n=1 Tax=Falsarthrobacter nasiphocae TaxID=189863 RepID=A0AAE3YEU6_9MICC|nr:HipA domain-containing protein [Falsarthrobacter nasiphocae]MDR6891915.1 serine/threonine-protein kinase HipA [Falsarthrobacter nasiphocae]
MNTELTQVRSADVWKAGHRAGVLQRTDGGGVVFQYLPGYLSEHRPAVATTLPLTSEPVHAPQGALPPFFAGLLPEGRRFSMLARSLKTSSDDELTLLLAVGHDTPGDVVVVPSGQTPQEPQPLIRGPFEEEDFAALLPRVDQISLPGVQAKASASMVTFPVSGSDARWILKLNPAEYPRLVENEAVHLTAARGLGLGVAEHALVRDKNGVPGLLVTRFDRLPSGGRLAFEDGAQVLGLAPANKYQPSSEEVVLALAAQARAPRIATRALYLHFLFAWLTGNGDAHAKNVGILDRGRGFEVAPVYDVPSTLPYRDTSLALPVDGRAKKLRRRHWDAFGAAIGLPPAAVKSAQRLALTAAAGADLAAVPFEGSPLHGAMREIRARRSELETA